MQINNKTKWFIIVGLLMVVFSTFIQHIGPWHPTELQKSILIGIGIGLELVGLILIRRNRLQTKQQ